MHTVNSKDWFFQDVSRDRSQPSDLVALPIHHGTSLCAPVLHVYFLMLPLCMSEIIEAMVHMAISNQSKFIGNSTGFRMVSALQVNLGILQIDPGLNDTKDHIDMVQWENMETYVLRTTFDLLMIFDSHSSGCFRAQNLVNAMNFQHWMPSAQPEPSCSLGLENQFSQPWWNVATNEPPSHQDMLSLFQSPITHPSEFSNISVSFSARNPCQRQGGLHGSDQFNHCLFALLKSSAPIFQSSQSCRKVTAHNVICPHETKTMGWTTHLKNMKQSNRIISQSTAYWCKSMHILNMFKVAA